MNDDKRIQVFAHGACSGNPGPAGVGIVLQFGPHKKEHFNYIGPSTNNKASLLAVSIGLNTIIKKSYPVCVFTNSQYAIGVLEGIFSIKSNQDLIEEIKNLMAKFESVRFKKVGSANVNTNYQRACYLARKPISQILRKTAA